MRTSALCSRQVGDEQARSVAHARRRRRYERTSVFIFEIRLESNKCKYDRAQAAAVRLARTRASPTPVRHEQLSMRFVCVCSIQFVRHSSFAHRFTKYSFYHVYHFVICSRRHNWSTTKKKKKKDSATTSSCTYSRRAARRRSHISASRIRRTRFVLILELDFFGFMSPDLGCVLGLILVHHSNFEFCALFLFVCLFVLLFFFR